MIVDFSKPLIECVVNISEGRDNSILDDLKEAARHRDQAEIVHIDQGYDANRTVLTLVGRPEQVFSLVESFFPIVLGHLDMSRQSGEHPRIGAIDVIPFIPLLNISKTLLTELTSRFARSISEKYSLPVFCYGKMSSNPDQKDLWQIRKGGYENLQKRLNGGRVKPDFGPRKTQKRLGASCVTVRDLMVAYNINLMSKDDAKARKLAKELRKRRSDPNHFDITENGSLLWQQINEVKILAWYMEKYGTCQISTNVYNIDSITLIELYDWISEVAIQYDIKVAGSELIGMIPLRAIGHRHSDEYVAGAQLYLGLNSVKPFQAQKNILEKRIGYAGLF